MKPFQPVKHMCVLCGEEIPQIDRGDVILSLENHILQQDEAFAAFCKQPGTTLHQRCFHSWKDRRLYIRLFNEYHSQVDPEDYSIYMKQNGSVEWHWHRQKSGD